MRRAAFWPKRLDRELPKILHVAGFEPGTPKLAPTLLYALRPYHLRYAAWVKMLLSCCTSITPHSYALFKGEPKFQTPCQTRAGPVPDPCLTCARPVPDLCRTCDRPLLDPCQSHAGPMLSCFLPIFSRPP